MSKNLNKEGSIRLVLQHPDKDWSTNNRPYKWSGTGRANYQAFKHPDGTFEISVNIPEADRDFIIRTRTPKCDARGLHFTIAWKDKEITVYLNGKIDQAIKE